MGVDKPVITRALNETRCLLHTDCVRTAVISAHIALISRRNASAMIAGVYLAQEGGGLLCAALFTIEIINYQFGWMLRGGGGSGGDGALPASESNGEKHNSPPDKPLIRTRLKLENLCTCQDTCSRGRARGPDERPRELVMGLASCAAAAALGNAHKRIVCM